MNIPYLFLGTAAVGMAVVLVVHGLDFKRVNDRISSWIKIYTQDIQDLERKIKILELNQRQLPPTHKPPKAKVGKRAKR